jgi:hypothetical protein
VSYPVTGTIFLTPHAALLPNMQPPPTGEVVADLLMSAEYRDDPSSANGLCTANRVVPAGWRLTLAGGTRTVRNQSHAADSQTEFSRLLTCKGQIDTPTPISGSGTAP